MTHLYRISVALIKPNTLLKVKVFMQALILSNRPNNLTIYKPFD